MTRASLWPDHVVFWRHPPPLVRKPASILTNHSLVPVTACARGDLSSDYCRSSQHYRSTGSNASNQVLAVAMASWPRPTRFSSTLWPWLPTGRLAPPAICCRRAPYSALDPLILLGLLVLDPSETWQDAGPSPNRILMAVDCRCSVSLWGSIWRPWD